MVRQDGRGTHALRAAGACTALLLIPSPLRPPRASRHTPVKEAGWLAVAFQRLPVQTGGAPNGGRVGIPRGAVSIKRHPRTVRNAIYDEESTESLPRAQLLWRWFRNKLCGKELDALRADRDYLQEELWSRESQLRDSLDAVTELKDDRVELLSQVEEAPMMRLLAEQREMNDKLKSQLTKAKKEAAEAASARALLEASGESWDSGKQATALRIQLDEEKRRNEEAEAQLNKDLLQSEAARQYLMEELLSAKASVSSLTTGLAEIQELVGDALEPASLDQAPAEPAPMDSASETTADARPESAEKVSMSK